MAIRITDVEMVLQRRGVLSTHEIPPVRNERLAESSADVGELIEGGGVDAAKVEKRHNDAVTFRPSGRAGERFVRNAVQRVVEFMVAATSVVWFGDYGEVRRPSMRPVTCCGEARLLGTVSHAPQGLGG